MELCLPRKGVQDQKDRYLSQCDVPWLTSEVDGSWPEKQAVARVAVQAIQLRRGYSVNSVSCWVQRMTYIFDCGVGKVGSATGFATRNKQRNPCERFRLSKAAANRGENYISSVHSSMQFRRTVRFSERSSKPLFEVSRDLTDDTRHI